MRSASRDVVASETVGAAIDAASRHTNKLRFMEEGFKKWKF